MRVDSFWEHGAPLPFTPARYSGLSVGVPGTVAGWADALSRYGTMSLAEALAPAIRIAREGFVIDATFFSQTQGNVDFFDDIPASAALFLDPDGTPKDVGTIFRNPDLAHAYERIAHLGAKGFYRGAIADAIVETVQRPPVAPTANNVWRPGLMTMRDLHTYEAPERAPTRVSYRGLDVYGMGPPSSGGSTVGEALNILEGYPLATETRERQLHLFLEASRYSFADRGALPRRRGLRRRAAARAPLRRLRGDTAGADHGDGGARARCRPVTRGRSTALSRCCWRAHRPTRRVVSTTHLSVSDRWGNVVSYTFTIESTGGAGLVVPGWGFLLNNELTDFDFALLNHPNSVAGGKRPRSSMAPTIVTQGGAAAADGRLAGRLDDHHDGPAAARRPARRGHDAAGCDRRPAGVTAERRDDRGGARVPGLLPVATALEARGHRFVTAAEIGAATGIEFLPAGGVVAAAEPTRRGGGSAMVETPMP